MLTFSSYLEDNKNKNEIIFFLSQKEQSETILPTDLSLYIDEADFIEDEGYSFEDFLDMDSEHCIFKGIVDKKDFVCIEHSGYHMIFTKNGDDLNLKHNEIIIEEREEPLNWLLSQFNSPLSFSNMGIEKFKEEFETYDKIKSDTSTRYIAKNKNGEYTSGVQVTDNVISNAYTKNEFRKKGLSRSIIEIANIDFPNLRHSDSRTELGNYLFENIKLSNKVKSKLKNTL
jgi:hypothetical protein